MVNNVEIILDLDNWTIPAEYLHSNQDDPIKAELYKDLRIFGAEMIQLVGISLRLPQVVMSTAQMLFQRIYYTNNYSFEDNHVDMTAMTTLFLATKIEEQHKSSVIIIEKFVSELSKKLASPVKLCLESTTAVKSRIHRYERLILKNLGFCVRSSHPHKLITIYHAAMMNAFDKEKMLWSERDRRKLVQSAWNFCNDSLRSDVFVQHPREAVACTCYEMAINETQTPFPRSSDNRPWYYLFNITDEQINEIRTTILSLYRRPFPEAEKINDYLYFSRFCSNT